MAGIFDKVVDGLNKGVATVSANSKAMVEKTQVKTVIKHLEAERKELADLLGMKIYQTYIDAGEMIADESVANFIVEIGKRLDSITKQEAELKRIEDELSLITGTKTNSKESESLCSCGQTVTLGARFCVKCGNAL